MTRNDRVQVGRYLDRLDEELLRLPERQREELRAQIEEHLDDALPPDVSDHEVGQVLSRLGSPEAVVAEALGEAPVRRRRLRWPRLRWRTWAAIVVVLALFGSALGYVVDMYTQPALVGEDGGWYTADGGSDRYHSNVFGAEDSVAARPGQRQGFDVEVYNPSSNPETVVGLGSESFAGLGTNFQTPAQLGVGRTGSSLSDGEHLAYALPGTIPPGQSRWIRFSWVTQPCQHPAGGSESMTELQLRVKVGWFTHNQTIQLPVAFALRSTKASNRGCTYG